MIYYKKISSPTGELTLVASETHLTAIIWENDNPKRVKLPVTIFEKQNHDILQETEKQLGEYFALRRTKFDLPLQFNGTEFQKKVWYALTRIPYGETSSYSQLAQEINCPGGYRAVGSANGKNPISIIVPCHRVIGANGKLTGFAGGINNKRLLLTLEKNEIN